MDKNGAIKIVRNYTNKLKKTNIGIFETWLFGSYAKETYNSNSDIDLAIVLVENEPDFEKEILLMTLRNGDETLIEPHLFSKKDFLKIAHLLLKLKVLVCNYKQNKFCK